MARYTPQQWNRLLWSWELDPPVSDEMRSLRRLLAQLIADQRNIHRGKDAQAVSASDFLPAPEPEEEDDTDQPDQPAPVMPDAMRGLAREHSLGLLPGHGARPPGRAMEAFFGKTEGEG